MWKGWVYTHHPNPLCLMTENIIKAAYLRYSRKEKPCTWRQIMGWTQDNYIQDFSNITEKEYPEVKGILSRLSTWYGKYYLGDYCEPGLTNIPVALALGNDCYYKDNLPILGSKNKLRIYDFDYATDGDTYSSYTGARIYNDLAAQARVWAFEQATDLNVQEYVRFVIGNQAIGVVKITMEDKLKKKNKKYMKYILEGIKEQISYPAFTEQCLNCPYNKKCSY